MNRFVLMLSLGVVLILVPIGIVLYGYWDIHQPKLGAVGDGDQKFLTVPVLIPLISSLILGVGNIHAAIVYRKQNMTQPIDKNDDVIN